jgi:hypothetical protein
MTADRQNIRSISLYFTKREATLEFLMLLRGKWRAANATQIFKSLSNRSLRAKETSEFGCAVLAPN